MPTHTTRQQSHQRNQHRGKFRVQASSPDLKNLSHLELESLNFIIFLLVDWLSDTNLQRAEWGNPRKCDTSRHAYRSLCRNARILITIFIAINLSRVKEGAKTETLVFAKPKIGHR